MNLPNLITLSRLVITAGVFVCLEVVAHGSDRARDLFNESMPSYPGQLHDTYVVVEPTLVWTAFGLFLAAAITDFVDGWLARKWNLVTAFGRVADPFADKVLIAGSLITLLQFHAAMTVLTTWYVVIVVAREFLVTAIRGVVEASGQPFPADKLGKWKMVTQCVFVASLLSEVAGGEIWRWVMRPAFWLSLVLTVLWIPCATYR
jgi:CDP-diacylglycerol--glycerol-3-phosphate 3-phosphatidyltransferase